MAVRDHLTRAVRRLDEDVAQYLEDLRRAEGAGEPDLVDHYRVSHSLAVATLAHARRMLADLDAGAQRADAEQVSQNPTTRPETARQCVVDAKTDKQAPAMPDAPSAKREAR